MENLMPRFYFHLASKDAHIPDDSGKELDTLNDAYMHARKLIDKVLFRVGHDDAEAWKVVISNNQHDAQMIIPFSPNDRIIPQVLDQILRSGLTLLDHQTGIAPTTTLNSPPIAPERPRGCSDRCD